jgi:hypothetical protein
MRLAGFGYHKGDQAFSKLEQVDGRNQEVIEDSMKSNRKGGKK